MFKYTIEYIKDLAIQKFGKCLSEECKGAHHKLNFECMMGHKFELSPSKLKNANSWCQVCSQKLYERICRTYFEQIFGKSFQSSYPKWLINSKNNRMQLDGYNEELGIAFEHQGIQHYEKSYYSKTDEEFLEGQIRDKEKLKLCIQNNVKLIYIPELETLLPIKNLKEHIRKECINQNVKLPDNFDILEIDISKAYISEDHLKVEKMKEIIKKYDGELIDNFYLSSGYKYNVMCKNGNKFKITYDHLRKGVWCGCKKCFNEKRKFSEDDISKLIDFYKSGLTIKEAAAKIGMKKSYAFVILSKENLTRTKSESRKSVTLKRKYSDEDIFEMKVLYNNGKNVNQIAKLYDIDFKTVKRYLKHKI